MGRRAPRNRGPARSSEAQDGCEAFARSADPALHGADLAAEDGGCILVPEAIHRHQQQGLPLLGGKGIQRGLHLGDCDPVLLVWSRGQRPGKGAIDVLDLAPQTLALVQVGVSQDREHPRDEVGAVLELGPVLPGPQQGRLDQVVGLRGGTGANPGELAQARHEEDQFVSERLRDLSLSLRVEKGGPEPKQNPTEPRIGIDCIRSRDELVQSPSDVILDVTG